VYDAGIYTYDASHKFTGKERDSESGNDYGQARYNVSRLARFSSPDLVADRRNRVWKKEQRNYPISSYKGQPLHQRLT
jgi:hypothetical protein